MKYKANAKLKEIASIFASHSYSLYLVGGAVRDFLLERKNDDYDLTTSALPEEVKSMFRCTIDTGIKHGTVTVIYKGEHYEITTFRTEGDYTDSRHPDSVTFVRSLEEDLKRRDFTINALAVDILSGEIIDMHGGISDLHNGIIRAIGDARERFREDALRMMRACRFSSKLGFTIEPLTLDAAAELHDTITKVSIERIKEEMDKLLTSPFPVKGLVYLRDTGLLSLIMPSLTLTPEILQAVGRGKENGLPLTSLYAVLFSGMTEKEAESILTAMKASNREREEVGLLVKAWKYDEKKNTGYDARLFIRDNGKEMIPAIFALRDTLAEPTDNDKIFRDSVNEEIRKNSPTSIKELAVSGRDLSAVVEPGPKMGEILKYLLEKVLENPECNTRDGLLALINAR